jgi:hypothetical protein
MKVILAILCMISFTIQAQATPSHKTVYTHLTPWCKPKRHVQGCLPKPQSFTDYSKPSQEDVNQ